jgi:amino acid adenylation domain-containing protein/thioester reductase-like protein
MGTRPTGIPAGRPLLAALAATELLARFGRDAGVSVWSAGRSDPAIVLPDWPELVRDLDVAAAAQVVGQLATGTDSAGGAALRVHLGPGRLPSHGGPTVYVSGEGNRPAVTVDCPPSDGWYRHRNAVAEAFGALLADLSAGTGTPATAAGLSTRSREQVLSRFAGGVIDYGRYQPVIGLIERQVDQSPHRPALTFGSRTLRYRQVDRLANGLAASLAERGVQPGDVIPVAIGNCLELPLAYLALMKLGAAFVPIDPAWPAGRIRTAIEVIHPKLVLRTADVVVAHPAPSMVVLLAGIAPSPTRPAVYPGPDALVYGVFTSGTTGTPKCALNVQRGLANRFRFMTRYFAAAGDQVVLQNSRPTFDSSIWQLFWPLTTGAHTVIPRQGEYLNLEETIRVIARHAVTVTDFVPGVFNTLVAMVDSDRRALHRIRSLRHLVIGGEEISPRAVHRLRALLPGLAVTNGYGPSEASIGMIFHPVDATDGDLVPLGRPIDNCYALITDDRTNLLPPGAVGEILIGGACLGAGYLDDPARTEAAFIPNPFPELAGERLYRTGDLGYVNADGRLFFAGRRDNQVKIDGVRIELGEIESAAAGIAGVHDARAIVVTGGQGLSLALALAADAAVTEAGVLRHLASVLPRTNVPRHLLLLPQFPLTHHGKVDRRALDARLRAHLAGPPPDRPVPPPVGHRQTEAVLAVFRRVLDSPALRPDDEFMRSGGDSLRAVAAVLQLRATWPGIGVHDLYAAPTAAALARLLSARPAGAPAVALDDRGELTDAARDARLPADLTVRPVEAAGVPETILITGASGFVGSRTVYEALHRTSAEVLALVRAPDGAAATHRVVETLTRQGLWRPEFAGRLHGYPGDLAQPSLGLAARDWQRLAAEVDVIIHAGALVNFLFDYAAHRGANVAGTASVLRLAMTGRVKPLHHVSTLGVLDREAGRTGDRLLESFDPAMATTPATGYSRSKLVAELLLREATAKGAAVTTYRLGEIMPSADNGVPNGRALTHLLLTACVRLEICPDVPLPTDYTPVDYVARVLVAGAIAPAAHGRTLHVFHPAPVDLGDVLAGAAIARVPVAEFLDRLAAAAYQDNTLRLLHALVSLDGQWRGQTLLADNPRLFDCSAGQHLANQAGIPPVAPPEAMAAYRNYLLRNRKG